MQTGRPARSERIAAMPDKERDKIFVLGAGVVGLACAVELQNRGFSVCLIDADSPGAGCSYGNAGIIAASEIFPIISPARLIALPRMLADSDGPVAVRFSALPRLSPWLLRAAASLRARRQREIIKGLAALNKEAIPAWRHLLEICSASNLMTERGMIGLTRLADANVSLEKGRQALGDWDLRSRILTAHEVRELEPNIHRSVSGGLLHESDAQVADPLSVSKALLARFLGGSGHVIRQRVEAVLPSGEGCHIRTNVETHIAEHVVVATGIDSGNILSPLGVTVPLQAERGYHLNLHGGGGMLDRPVTFLEESCVATPMGGFLRLAGTVEFADPHASPRWPRADRLRAVAQRYFEPELPETNEDRWVGSRPSLPDSLPAIGGLKAFPRVSYAFGHQHLGLTQAAISAKVIADLISLKRPLLDCTPYAIERFGGTRRRCGGRP